MNFETYMANRFRKSNSYKSTVSSPIIKISVSSIVIGIVMMVISISSSVGLQNTIQTKVSSFFGHISISNFENNSSLSSLKPNAQWTWTGDEYSGLKWLDSGTAPTESEIDAEVTRLTNAEPMRLLRLERNTRLTACDWRASSDLTLSIASLAAFSSISQIITLAPASINLSVIAKPKPWAPPVTTATRSFKSYLIIIFFYFPRSY